MSMNFKLVIVILFSVFSFKSVAFEITKITDDKTVLTPFLLVSGNKLIISPMSDQVSPSEYDLNTLKKTDFKMSPIPMAIAGIAMNSQYIYVCHRQGTLLSQYSRITGNLNGTLDFSDIDQSCTHIDTDKSNPNLIYTAARASQQLIAVNFANPKNPLMKILNKVSGGYLLKVTPQYIFTGNLTQLGYRVSPLVINRSTNQAVVGDMMARPEYQKLKNEFTFKIEFNAEQTKAYYMHFTENSLLEMDINNPVSQKELKLKIERPWDLVAYKKCLMVFGTKGDDIAMEIIKDGQRIDVIDYITEIKQYNWLNVDIDGNVYVSTKDGVSRISNIFPPTCLN